MSKDFVQIDDDVISEVRLLREGAPDLMKAFGALATAATTSKAIDAKTKELMALAIGGRHFQSDLMTLRRAESCSVRPIGGRAR